MVLPSRRIFQVGFGPVGAVGCVGQGGAQGERAARHARGVARAQVDDGAAGDGRPFFIKAVGMGITLEKCPFTLSLKTVSLFTKTSTN